MSLRVGRATSLAEPPARSLDRTNVVEDMISQAALESFFDSAAKHNETFEPFRSPAHAVWAHHRVMWAENGDGEFSGSAT